MTKQEVQARIDQLKPWYHSIPIPTDEGDVLTPGEPYQVVWDIVRKARSHIDYTGSNVLDIASFDGMWSFEAEHLGAKQVIATDCNWRAYPNFLFAKEAKRSAVMPLYNVSVYELAARLDSFLGGHNVFYKARDSAQPEPRPVFQDPRFDIVHCMGLLYHLRDPMLGLLQCRSVMKDGAKLLVETAYFDSPEPVMVINPAEKNERCVYDDPTTWWAPSPACLTQMLRLSLFEPVFKSISVTALSGRIGRMALVAEAVPSASANAQLVAELKNRYRTPGLV